MRFRPAWAYIEGIREFGRFFCQVTYGATDMGERARVVLQEALENAVKYSTGEDTELEVMITAIEGQLEFSVSSLPDPKHLPQLKAELEQLAATDPEEAYLAAFVRASEQPDAASRLGLARMRYEGGVELSAREEDGGRIRVTARAKL